MTFRATASTAYGSRITSTTVSKPTGTVDGDIMVMMFVAGRGDLPGLSVETFPSGWTAIGTSAVSTDSSSFNIQMWVWWKRASSEGSSYDFLHVNTLSTAACIVSYSGMLASGNPVDVFSQNAASTGSTATGTGVTTTVANTTLCYLQHNWDASGTLSPPTGMTERYDNIIYHADEARASAGATSNRTQTLASSTNPWQVYMAALKPATVATKAMPIFHRTGRFR